MEIPQVLYTGLNQVTRGTFQFDDRRNLNQRMFVGYSTVVDYRGRRARVPLWYTWYLTDTGMKTQVYDGPTSMATKLTQTKFPFDMRTVPVELTRVSASRWKKRAEKVWSIQFGPPTWAGTGHNGTFIPASFITWGERMPAVEGSGQAGQIWISDAECLARYDDSSVECPQPVFERIRFIWACRNWSYNRSLNWEFYRDIRAGQISSQITYAINAGLDSIEYLENESNHIGALSMAKDLRVRVRKLQEDKQAGRQNPSTWQHIVDVRKIVGDYDLEDYDKKAFKRQWAHGRDRVQGRGRGR